MAKPFEPADWFWRILGVGCYSVQVSCSRCHQDGISPKRHGGEYERRGYGHNYQGSRQDRPGACQAVTAFRSENFTNKVKMVAMTAEGAAR